MWIPRRIECERGVTAHVTSIVDGFEGPRPAALHRILEVTVRGIPVADVRRALSIQGEGRPFTSLAVNNFDLPRAVDFYGILEVTGCAEVGYGRISVGVESEGRIVTRLSIVDDLNTPGVAGLYGVFEVCVGISEVAYVWIPRRIDSYGRETTYITKMVYNLNTPGIADFFRT